MKPYYDLVIVIPLRATSNAYSIIDTIESINFYIEGCYKIIIADKLQRKIAEFLQKLFPEIDIVRPEKIKGTKSSEYINLANAYKYAFEHYNFDLLLKMSDDTLVTARNPEKQVLDIFTQHPDVGIIGLLSMENNSIKPNNVNSRNAIISATCTWKFIRQPIVNLTLRKIVFKAFDNGYKLGENIPGEAYFISRNCLQKLYNADLLSLHNLTKCSLSETNIFSILVKVIDMELRNLSFRDDIFRSAPDKLPGEPEQFPTLNKKTMHPVRFWKEKDITDIGLYFKQRRIERIHLNPTNLN